MAFAGVAVSVLCLLAGAILGRKGESSLGETLTWGGHIASILTTVALTVCCSILVYCFFAGDYSIEYVLKQHSNAEGALGWLFKLSGLWAAARARCCSGRGLSACSIPWWQSAI